MNDDDIGKIFIYILLIALCLWISAAFTKCVVESDMPLWTKIWLLN